MRTVTTVRPLSGLLRICLVAFAALAVFGASPDDAFAQGGITYRFSGGTAVDEGGQRYYDVTITAQASQSGTQFADGSFYINYNTDLFGPTVSASYTKGALLNAGNYIITMGHNGPSTLSVTVALNGSAASLPNGSAEDVFHLRFPVPSTGDDSHKSVGLSFDSVLMQGTAWTADMMQYDPVTASDTDGTTVPGGSGSLPVTFAGVEALVQDADVTVRWNTASERNNSGFEIQHALVVDGEAGPFETVASVAGAGTTAEPQSYAYTVRGLPVGTHRFRVKQVDFDGAASYSDVVEAVVAPGEAFAMGEPYPNPFNPQTRFDIAVQRTQQVRVEVYNTLGQRVARLFDGIAEGGRAHSITFAADMLPSGTYFITAIGEDVKATKMVTLVK